jgi:hypothetical protein
LLATALLAALAVLLPGPCLGSCADVQKQGCCPEESAPQSDCCCPPGIDVCCEAQASVAPPAVAAQIHPEVVVAPAEITPAAIQILPALEHHGFLPPKTDLYLRIRVLLI